MDKSGERSTNWLLFALLLMLIFIVLSGIFATFYKLQEGAETAVLAAKIQVNDEKEYSSGLTWAQIQVNLLYYGSSGTCVHVPEGIASKKFNEGVVHYLQREIQIYDFYYLMEKVDMDHIMGLEDNQSWRFCLPENEPEPPEPTPIPGTQT